MMNELETLSTMPGPEEGMPPGGIQFDPGMQGQEGLGGPGIDTPQEQQAVELLMQAGQLMRQAAETDPSIGHIVDKTLQDAFLQIAQFYGFGEDAKLALKQAQTEKSRQRMSHFGPPGQAPSGPMSPMMQEQSQQFQTPFQIQY